MGPCFKERGSGSQGYWSSGARMSLITSPRSALSLRPLAWPHALWMHKRPLRLLTVHQNNEAKFWLLCHLNARLFQRDVMIFLSCYETCHMNSFCRDRCSVTVSMQTEWVWHTHTHTAAVKVDKSFPLVAHCRYRAVNQMKKRTKEIRPPAHLKPPPHIIIIIIILPHSCPPVTDFTTRQILSDEVLLQFVSGVGDQNDIDIVSHDLSSAALHANTTILFNLILSF